MDLYVCGVAGLVVTGLIIWMGIPTGVNFRPVKSVAAASVTGHGTNVIQMTRGLDGSDGAAGYIVIVIGILVTYSLAGLFGIAIAVTTMLRLRAWLSSMPSAR